MPSPWAGIQKVIHETGQVGRDRLRPAVERMRSFVAKLSYGKPVVLEDAYGIRFILEPWDAGLKRRRIARDFYREEFSALRSLVSEGDTIFDVGAHVGLHATLFSRWVGEDGRILAFEPVPDTVWRLRETLALNRCGNVQVFQLALLDHVGSAMINVFDPKHADWNSFGLPRYGGVVPTQSVEVPVDTLDAFCERMRIDRIDFLKIDVEGFEKSTLLGAIGMLERGRVGALSFEISQVPLAGSAVEPREVFALLSDFGYISYEYSLERKGFVGPISDSAAYYTNYYASRRDLRGC